MNPLEFMSAVLPTTGVYCAAELSTTKKEHVYAKTIGELKPHIQRFIDAKYNTYFALASFGKAGSRMSDNAMSMRSLFLDIDCGAGKPYKTKRNAVEALDAFLRATGLPAPWLVSSGGGVHVYWPFIEPVGIPEWKLTAENLKRLCKQHGLDIDFTVTADAARVLRVPGTVNWKDPANPRPVTIKVVGAPQHHLHAELAAQIESTLQEPQQASSTLFDVPGERLERPTTPSLVKVLENRVTFFKAILKRTAAGTGCGQLGHYLTHADEEGMEPLWRGMLSLAKVCNDGEKAAEFLTKLHPYSDARMHQKLREIKGPYPCVKLDSENPGICTSCTHWGKITNPLSFGHEVQTSNEAKQIELPATSPVAAPTTVTRPTPPYGYAYGAKGGVYKRVKDQDAEGNVIYVDKMILGYDLFVVDLLDGGEEGHLVQLLAMRPEGPTALTIPQRTVVSKDETVKALAEKNILAAYGAGNDKFLFDYVRAATEDVSAARKARVIPQSFGWQKDGTFVFNGRIFSAQGEQRIPMPKLNNVVRITEPAGTLDKWREVVQLLINREHHDILAMALISFGSPIMHFSPFKSLVFHIGSSESGTGKSISLGLGASIWGMEQYIINAKASQVMQEHRMGTLNSMPLIIDEITETNKDFEWISAFIMDMSGGLGKERMKGATNEERENFTFWRALMLLASNTHVTDFFSAVRKKISEGHLRRMLEMKMEETITWDWNERETIGLLRDNYGIAGEHFVRWLVRNKDTAKDVFNTVYRNLDKEMKATGDERFWIAGCAACIAGGILIGSKYANIIDLPLEAISKIYKEMIKEARDIVRISKKDAEDILNAYTREFFGNFVVLKINDATKKMETSFGDGGIIDKTVTRSHVKGRVEHGSRAGHVSYYIEENQMKAYCSTMNYGYKDFKKKLEKVFSVTYVKKDLLSKTVGPQMRVSAMRIVRPDSLIDEDEDEQQEVPVE